MLYDFFICHASEDKESFVRPLAEALRRENLEVWYDEFALKLGDSIRRSLDKGLNQSRFGVVVLSKAFFDKQWTQYELDGFVEREMKGRDKVILPIWHGITHADVLKYSPSLTGRKAVLSSMGMEKVVQEILDVLRPQGSPLIIARDTLLAWGITPPVITDPYWLEVVEASNRLPGFGAQIPVESTWLRWGFPLPEKEDGVIQWGERLAWTAMQMNWVKSADEIPITPLTHPKELLHFIHSHPGLFETCFDSPGLVAEYAPQLTIPGFGGDLEQSLEEEYQRSCRKVEQRHSFNPSYGSALTIDGQPPLCEEEWSLRHPTFGNHDSMQVAHAYFSGGIFGPLVSPYEETDHLFWLLSTTSSWLPDNIHAYLLKGMTENRLWTWGYIGNREKLDWENSGELARAIFDSTDGKQFEWTEQMKNDLIHRIKLSVKTLGLPDTIEEMFEHLINYNPPQRLITSEKRTKRAIREREAKDR